MKGMGSFERVLVLGIVVVILAILGIAMWGAQDDGAGALDAATDGGAVVEAPVIDPAALPANITPPGEAPASPMTEIEKLRALRDQRTQQLAQGQPAQVPGVTTLTDGGSDVASGAAPSGGVPLNHVVPADAGAPGTQPAAPIAGAAPLPLEQPAPVATPAAETIYTVVSGDNLWKIVKKHYGDGSVQAHIDAILAANPTLSLDESLKIGQKLKLPAAAAKDPARLPAEQQAAATGSRVYVVKEGDTLSTIASKELGSSKKWTEIYELNRARISDPAKIKVGMKLTLPPKG